MSKFQADEVPVVASKLPSYGIGQLSQYHAFEQVGEGSYGFVYRAKCKLTGEIVALKKLAFSKTTNGVSLWQFTSVMSTHLIIFIYHMAHVTCIHLL